MHVTLTKQTNRRLILICAGFAALLLMVTRGRAAPCCGLGAALGITAGLLQSKTLRERAREFAQSKTAFDVRRVLTSTGAGALSISLTWICGALLSVVSIYLASGSKFVPTTPLAVLLNVLAGFFTFMLVRDAIAYGALGRVAEAAEAESVSGDGGDANER